MINRLFTGISRRSGRRLVPLLAAVLLCASLLLSAKSVIAEPVRITFLHINDFYEIEPVNGIGGAAELMTVLRNERRRNENTITTFGGDLISPSLFSGLTQGAQMIELFDALQFDVAVLGNHEFDFGGDVLRDRIDESGFVWLGANVRDSDGDPAFGVRDIWITRMDGITVGFFGVLSPHTVSTSVIKEPVNFTPVLAASQAAVDELRDEGVDIIVALTHMDLEEDRQLAEEVEGIDLILGGHEHVPVSIVENDVLIHKSGTNGDFLGVISLVIEEDGDTDRGLTVYPEWRMVAVRNVDPDPLLGPLIRRYTDGLDERLDVVIGRAPSELDSRSENLRSEETSMGNLVADALRIMSGADIAIINGGGIRGDRIYEAGDDLRRRDILTELPFRNVAVVVRLTGAQIIAALENGVSEIERGSGRFPQVSGLNFVFDPDRGDGGRIIEATIDGEELDMNGRYLIATTDYLLSGGDGYTAFTRGNVQTDADQGPQLASLVINYIETSEVVSPAVSGRITER